MVQGSGVGSKLKVGVSKTYQKSSQANNEIKKCITYFKNLGGGGDTPPVATPMQGYGKK